MEDVFFRNLMFFRAIVPSSLMTLNFFWNWPARLAIFW